MEKIEQDSSYLELVLSQSVRLPDIQPSFDILKAKLSDMFQKLQSNVTYKGVYGRLDDIYLTGSVIKGTAIKCRHDIDVLCSWKRISMYYSTCQTQLEEECVPLLRLALVNINGVFYVKDSGFGAKILWKGRSYHIRAVISGIELKGMKWSDGDEELLSVPSTSDQRSRFIAAQEDIVKSSVMLIKLLRVHDITKEFHILLDASVKECDFIPSYALELLVIHWYSADKQVNLKCLTEKVLKFLATIEPLSLDPQILYISDKMPLIASESVTHLRTRSDVSTPCPLQIIDGIDPIGMNVLHQFRHWLYLRDSARRGLEYLQNDTFCKHMYEAIHKHQLEREHLNPLISSLLITAEPLPRTNQLGSTIIHFEEQLKNEDILDIPPIWAVNTVTEPLSSSASAHNPDLSRTPEGPYLHGGILMSKAIIKLCIMIQLMHLLMYLKHIAKFICWTMVK